MILDDVHRGIQKRKSRKRIGRGPGSGHGKTAGKGHKGAYSRTGTAQRIGFAGGQVPLARRLAKVGFNNKYFARKVAIINLSVLEERFTNGETVTPEVLAERGLVKGNFDEIKILGTGKLTRKLTVRVHAFSKSAEERINAAGGKAERLIGS